MFSQNLKRQFLKSLSEWSPDSLFLSIVGPTASGKTDTALTALRNWPTHKRPLLVSVDAGAVYQGIDIGTAKPTQAEQQEFDWTGLGFVSPRKACDLNLYLSHVLPAIEQALSSGRPVWLVGGTHFYEQALTQGQMPGAASDRVFLSSLASVANQDLFEQLCQIDSRWTERVHPNDRYRLERFTDLAVRQRLSFDQLATPNPPRFHQWLQSVPTLMIGSQMPRAEYESRILNRVQTWLSTGWIDEVENLINSGLDPGCPGLNVMGYPQIVGLVQGRLKPTDAAQQIVTQHLQLVKKQKTWLRALRVSGVDALN